MACFLCSSSFPDGRRSSSRWCRSGELESHGCVTEGDVSPPLSFTGSITHRIKATESFPSIVDVIYGASVGHLCASPPSSAQTKLEMAKKNAKPARTAAVSATSAPAEIPFATVEAGLSDDSVVFRLIYFWHAHNPNKGGMHVDRPRTPID